MAVMSISIALCINITALAFIEDVSKISPPEYWFGIYSTMSAGIFGASFGLGLLTMRGLSTGTLLSFSLITLALSLKASAITLGITTCFGLLPAIELAAASFTSLAKSGASDFLLGIMDKAGDSLVSELCQAGASLGSGMCLAYAEGAGDLAGLAIGVDAGFSPGFAGIAGGFTAGIDVHGSGFNGAIALTLGATLGVSTEGASKFAASAVLMFAYPNNIHDWSLKDL